MRLTRKITVLTALVACTSLQAQVDNYGVFNHFGADINVGSQGIGFDISTPVTNYLEVSLGMNFMPDFKIDGDVDVNDIKATYTYAGQQVNYNIPLDEVNIEGKLGRTTADFKLNFYPFGKKNDLFIAAGFSFGGKKIAKLKGHNDEIGKFMRGEGVYATIPADAVKQVNAEIDKYEVDFNDNGDVIGDVRVHSFRPYVGLGYGRLVPKHRLGFRVELGCQFMGKMKIYQNNKEVDLNQIYQDTGEKATDDLSDFIDKFQVYPVLKISLTGRIF